MRQFITLRSRRIHFLAGRFPFVDRITNHGKWVPRLLVPIRCAGTLKLYAWVERVQIICRNCRQLCVLNTWRVSSVWFARHYEVTSTMYAWHWYNITISNIGHSAWIWLGLIMKICKTLHLTAVLNIHVKRSYYI